MEGTIGSSPTTVSKEDDLEVLRDIAMVSSLHHYRTGDL